MHSLSPTHMLLHSCKCTSPSFYSDTYSIKYILACTLGSMQFHSSTCTYSLMDKFVYLATHTNTNPTLCHFYWHKTNSFSRRHTLNSICLTQGTVCNWMKVNWADKTVKSGKNSKAVWIFTASITSNNVFSLVCGCSTRLAIWRLWVWFSPCLGFSSSSFDFFSIAFCFPLPMECP